MKINWTHKADMRIDEILEFYNEKSEAINIVTIGDCRQDNKRMKNEVI